MRFRMRMSLPASRPLLLPPGLNVHCPASRVCPTGLQRSRTCAGCRSGGTCPSSTDGRWRTRGHGGRGAGAWQLATLLLPLWGQLGREQQGQQQQEQVQEREGLLHDRAGMGAGAAGPGR